LRLQCEGYVRAVEDAILPLFNQQCKATWRTSDEAVAATVVYLNAHPELSRAPASTLIEAALLSPSCPSAPVIKLPRRAPQ
jgi:hypothetical protein